MTPYVKNSRRANQAKRCSSNWRSKTSRQPLTCSGQFTIGQTAWMDGCRSRFRRFLPTTRPALSLPPKSCLRARAGLICSSRFPARRKACPPLKRPSSPAFPINVTLLFSREHYPGGCRGIPSRHRAADRRGTQARCRLRCFRVCQPLGWCRERQSPCRTYQSTWHRDR